MHTPGPLEARDVQQNWIEILGPEVSGTQRILATVLPTQYAHLGKSAEQWANAKLFAAAPDLLAACLTAIAYFDGTRHGREWQSDTERLELRAAIAKTTGKGKP